VFILFNYFLKFQRTVIPVHL